MSENDQQVQNELIVNLGNVTYANRLDLNLSAFDFNFIFSHTLGENVLSSSTVCMSPSHAKSVLLLLQDSIEKYEERFGEITID